MTRAGTGRAWRAAGRRWAERMAAHPSGRIGLHVGALMLDGQLRWHAAGIARELAAVGRPYRARAIDGDRARS
jgi:hypothetical protein